MLTGVRMCCSCVFQVSSGYVGMWFDVKGGTDVRKLCSRILTYAHVCCVQVSSGYDGMGCEVKSGIRMLAYADVC